MNRLSGNLLVRKKKLKAEAGVYYDRFAGAISRYKMLIERESVFEFAYNFAGREQGAFAVESAAFAKFSISTPFNPLFNTMLLNTAAKCDQQRE